MMSEDIEIKLRNQKKEPGNRDRQGKSLPLGSNWQITSKTHDFEKTGRAHRPLFPLKILALAPKVDLRYSVQYTW